MQSVCPKCNGTTWIFPDEGLDPTPCDCRDADIQKRRANGLSKVVPREYLAVSLDEVRGEILKSGRPMKFEPSQIRIVRQFIAKMDQNIEQGKGLWLEGDTGTGKTSISMLVAKTALDRGFSVGIYSVPRLLAQIRSTFNDNSQLDYGELVTKLVESDLLVLEDLGTENQTDWAFEQLYTIVDERYSNHKSNIVTTNFTLGQLMGNGFDSSKLGRLADATVQSLGLSKPNISLEKRLNLLESALQDEAVRNKMNMARIVSRLAQRSTVIPLWGSDHRHSIEVADDG